MIVPVYLREKRFDMTVIVVSAKDFAADPSKFLSQAHQAQVLITHHGRFLELSKIDPKKEAEMIKAGIQILFENGELSTDGPGISVDDLLLEELQGRAT